MKFLLLFLFFINDPDIDKVRKLYVEAPESKTETEKLLKLATARSFENNLYLGYEGAAHIIMAKHLLLPCCKYASFKNGKQLLDSAIRVNRNDPELRFLRLSIQYSAPRFLGYTSNIKEDKAILTGSLDKINDVKLNRAIVSFLNSIQQSEK